MHWKLEATEHACCRGKYVPPPATPTPTLTAHAAQVEASAPEQPVQVGSAEKVAVNGAGDAVAPAALCQPGASPVVNAISSNKRQMEGSNPASPKRIRVETIHEDSSKPGADGQAKTADTSTKQVSISNFFSKMAQH